MLPLRSGLHVSSEVHREESDLPSACTAACASCPLRQIQTSHVLSYPVCAAADPLPRAHEAGLQDSLPPNTLPVCMVCYDTRGFRQRLDQTPARRWGHKKTWAIA